MAKNIPTTQWTRQDEPVLDLTTLRVVHYNGGYAVSTDENAMELALPTAGVIVFFDDGFWIQS